MIEEKTLAVVFLVAYLVFIAAILYDNCLGEEFDLLTVVFVVTAAIFVLVVIGGVIWSF